MTGRRTAATPLRVFLRHTSDLGKPGEVWSFVSARRSVWLRQAEQTASATSSGGPESESVWIPAGLRSSRLHAATPH